MDDKEDRDNELFSEGMEEKKWRRCVGKTY